MKLDRARVLRARELQGYGLEKTAEEAGVSKNSVLRAEHEEDIRPVTARKIAAALGMRVADLVAESETLKELPPPLEELHAAAGCETDWLICPEARWQGTWPRDPRPQEALQRVHETAAEFNKLKPLMAEQEQGRRPSQRAFGGTYQQAWRRFFATLQEAQARGVAAGIITDSETLYDLEERLGERPGHYLEDLLRAS